MAVRDFFAYVRALGWKVWISAAITVTVILVFFWPFGPLVLAVACLAMVPGSSGNADRSREAEKG
jgi:hypothetical protein